MAIRTTTTRTTTTVPEQFADQYAHHHADFSFEELVQAYHDCRKTKRNTVSALEFEVNAERNLISLFGDLKARTYKPGTSICFIITHPKPREVWAADFRDRVAHHLLYNFISERFHKAFIADSCACIPERGTLYAGQRLESKIRSITQNWSKPAHYLKMDLANFFVSINKRKVFEAVKAKVTEGWLLWLTATILFHDPRKNYELRGDSASLELVPPHKRLSNQTNVNGLPIGNLSSQFFANILMDKFDQWCKHHLQAKHYIRYVDDFIILHESPQWLNGAKRYIEAYLPHHLDLAVNPSKTILQPIERGVDFVGFVIKPWCRTTRKRTVKHAISRIYTTPQEKLFEVANSFFGLIGQASHGHHDKTKLANALRMRGFCINGAITKTYRKGLAA